MEAMASPRQIQGQAVTDNGLSAKSGGFCEAPLGMATTAKVGFLVHPAEQETRTPWLETAE
jgi:hypothetical protein